MTTTSASLAEDLQTPIARATTARILVWDVPVRVFHWLTVACFAGAWLTAESERWRLVHVSLGLAMAALVVFRLFWGLAGTRYARFQSFVRGPRAVIAYLRSLIGPTPHHHVGHNPAGGWAVIALLALMALVTATGWANYQELAGGWMEDAHEAAAEALMALVGLHVAGVVISSVLHRENLVRAMVTGRKAGAAGDAIRSPWRTVGVLVILIAISAGLAGYVWTGPQANAGFDTRREAVHDEDDD